MNENASEAGMIMRNEMCLVNDGLDLRPLVSGLIEEVTNFI